MNEQLALFHQPTTARRFVYFGVRGGFIKIGVSDQPKRRARELGIALLRVEPGDEVDERRYHRRFAQARIDREWFMPSADLLSFLTLAAA